MARVFLTGGTGFIGGNLVEKLLEKGYKVKVLVRDNKKLKPHQWKDKVEIIYGDILEPESFEEKINDCEIIIHSAALIAWWKRIYKKIYKINVTGTRNVLEAALKSSCKKFIHISSVAAVGYGENGEPVNEDIDYNWGRFDIPYMETKRMAELEVKKAIDRGLNACMVNPANVWGVGDIRGRRVPLIKVLKFGFPFYTDGGTNFVDVDAVCEAIINAITLGRCGERYILGGENLTIKEFLEIITDEIGARRPFLKIPKLPIAMFSYLQEALGFFTGISPRPTASQLCFFGKYIYYDSSKAIRELKMPLISVKECIRTTVGFYRKQKFI